jgi:hypothetical protein
MAFYLCLKCEFAFRSTARTYDEVRMGTESYISAEGGRGLACINQDGNLRCGTDESWLPIDSTQFCRVSERSLCSFLFENAFIGVLILILSQSTTGTLQLTSSNPANYGCVPIALSLFTAPPPQPARRCGDYPINTPLYLSLPNPANPATSYLYGRTEDGDINGYGLSSLYTTTTNTLASPFIFNEGCALIRTTAAGTKSTATIGSVFYAFVNLAQHRAR